MSRAGTAPARAMAACCLALILLAASLAWADNPRLAGDYRLDAAAGDDVPALIEATVSEMNLFTRFFARHRLLNTNPSHTRVGIRLHAAGVDLLRDRLAPMRVPVGGRQVDWTREDGERFRVSCVWEGGVLAQRFVADDGERWNRYELSDDGRTLTLTVRITSPKLPAPLSYRLIYRRLP